MLVELLEIARASYLESMKAFESIQMDILLGFLKVLKPIYLEILWEFVKVLKSIHLAIL